VRIVEVRVVLQFLFMVVSQKLQNSQINTADVIWRWIFMLDIQV